MKCKLCYSDTKLKIIDLKFLSKYSANLFQCDTCMMLQLDKIDWLKEAYSESIAITDTGIVARNILLLKRVLVFLSVVKTRIWIPTIILRLFKKFLKPFLINISSAYKEKILDFGGGYGILVRLLRDFGLDAYWNDKYSQNLVARGFERNDEKYKTILSFEVLEHLENPREELDVILGNEQPDIFITSTLDFGDSIPSIDWWYYSFETGQHITFYNKQTFKKIAELYGYQYFSIDATFHVFSKYRINERLIRFFVERADYFFNGMVKKYHSFTLEDHKKLVEKIRTG